MSSPAPPAATAQPDTSDFGRRCGLKLVFFIIAISAISPFFTIWYNKVRRCHYQHCQPALPLSNWFCQVTWQDQPYEELQHVLFFLDKPRDYYTSDVLEIRAPKGAVGYTVYPRGVFFGQEELLSPVRRVEHDRSLRFWIICQNKAFPIRVPAELRPDWTSRADFASTLCFQQVIAPALEKFCQDLSAGKIDFKKPFNHKNFY